MLSVYVVLKPRGTKLAFVPIHLSTIGTYIIYADHHITQYNITHLSNEITGSLLPNPIHVMSLCTVISGIKVLSTCYYHTYAYARKPLCIKKFRFPM